MGGSSHHPKCCVKCVISNFIYCQLVEGCFRDKKHSHAVQVPVLSELSWDLTHFVCGFQNAENNNTSLATWMRVIVENRSHCKRLTWPPHVVVWWVPERDVDKCCLSFIKWRHLFWIMSLRTTECIQIQRVPLLEKKYREVLPHRFCFARENCLDKREIYSYLPFRLLPLWRNVGTWLLCRGLSLVDGCFSKKAVAAASLGFIHFFFQEEKMGQGDRRQPEYLIIFLINMWFVFICHYWSPGNFQFPWQKPTSCKGWRENKIYSRATVL